MKRFFQLSLLLSTFALAGSAVAQTAMTAQPKDVPVVFSTKNDVYMAGGTYRIDHDIAGDAIVAGGDVAINGKVKESVLAVGGTLSVNRDVGDDVRIAGGDVTVHGKVGGDVIALGGTVTIAPDAIIAGELVSAGGDIRMLGHVTGNVHMNGGTAVIGGVIGGNAIVKAGQISQNGTIQGFSKLSADTITLGPSAHFGKKVQYWQAAGAMVFGKSVSGAKNGAGVQTVFDTTLQMGHGQDRARGAFVFLLGALTISSLLSSALVILLLILITKKFFTETALRLKKEPGWCLLYGVIFVILTPVVALLLIATLIGLPLGILLLFAWLATLFFATPIAALIYAKGLQAKYKKKWGKPMLYLVSICAFVFLKLLVVVPIVGWLAKIILIMAALGAFLATKMSKWNKIA